MLYTNSIETLRKAPRSNIFLKNYTFAIYFENQSSESTFEWALSLSQMFKSITEYAGQLSKRQTDGWINLFRLNPLPAGLKEYSVEKQIYPAHFLQRILIKIQRFSHLRGNDFLNIALDIVFSPPILRSVNEKVSEYFRFVTSSFPSARPRLASPIFAFS